MFASERAQVPPTVLAFGIGAAIGFILGRGGKGAFGATARAGFAALATVVLRRVLTEAFTPLVDRFVDDRGWRSPPPVR